MFCELQEDVFGSVQSRSVADSSVQSRAKLKVNTFRFRAGLNAHKVTRRSASNYSTHIETVDYTDEIQNKTVRHNPRTDPTYQYINRGAKAELRAQS